MVQIIDWAKELIVNRINLPRKYIICFERWRTLNTNIGSIFTFTVKSNYLKESKRNI